MTKFRSGAWAIGRRFRALLWLIGAALLGPAFAADQDILKPEQAFRYVASADGDTVTVRWTIAPGHYMYRERMSYSSGTPGIVLRDAIMPRGEPHDDEFFGPMEIYRGEAVVRIPVSERPATATSLALTIKSQGCADIGLCYPPQTWTANVPLPPATAAASGAASGLTALLNAGSTGPDQPLPVEQAFRWTAGFDDPFTLRVSFRAADGYYLYRHSLKVSTDSRALQLASPELPPGTPKYDEEFGDTLVHYGEVDLRVPFTRSSPAALPGVPLTIEFQGCKDGSICYPPQKVQTVLELPAATAADAGRAVSALPVAEQDRWSRLIRDGNLLWVLGGFAFAGLLLAFTPCCYPMYPILSGIIVGQGTQAAAAKGSTRALLLSVSFVIGIALTYAILGAIAAAAGAKLQAFLQSPAVTIGVVLIFVALALSMFGLYDLQIPSSWQTRLNAISGRQQSGSYLGAGVMGMLSAAVLSPCVTPPLVGALMYIAQTGNVPRGAAALFALGCGMGVPLIAIGASAGKILPRAGAWMVGVKSAFGLVMLGMAVWMLDRLVPGSVTLALSAGLAMLTAFLLGAFAPVPADAGPAPKLAKGAGLLAMVYAAALLVGALAGNDNPLRPLQFRGASASVQAEAAAHNFTRIKTVADLDRELAAARTAGRPLMLDFYADWCVACKEFEKLTFPDPAVQQLLANAVTLQADVTAVDAADQALMERFGIIGPPTIVFFAADGTEQTALRVVGFQPAEKFAAHLRQVFDGGAAPRALAADQTSALAAARD